MIISIAAPKGGVGSSSFALLLTRERGKVSNTVLVDMSADPALDLYSGTAHILAPEFNGSLHECSVELQGTANAKRARLRPDQLSLLNLAEEGKENDSDFILDLGRPSEETISFLAKEKIPLILVLTQDNSVLRAGDELLGQLRNAGVDSSFIISMQDERDPLELADLDEIFGLIEEDFYGSISWQPELRIYMNQGKPELVSQKIQEEIEKINQKLNGDLHQHQDESDDYDQSDDLVGDDDQSDRLDDSQKIGELDEPHASSLEELALEPENVFSKIKQFFQNFGKGNQ